MSLRGFRSLLAVLEAGFEPAGVVMGAVGLQIIRPTGCRGWGPKTGTEPLIFPEYEQALRDAWLSVIGRLEAEATKVGAHGVAGVSVRQQGFSGPSADNPAVRGQQQVLQLQLVGTAIRVRGEVPLERPFLSMLSMDDTLKLLLRGWVPSGIAVGISAVHVHGWASSPYMQRVVFSNAEMTSPTAGMALARTRAEREVRRALVATRAEGTVASTVQVTRSAQSCGGQGMLIEGLMMGTGVVRYRDPVVPLSAVRNLSQAGAT